MSNLPAKPSKPEAKRPETGEERMLKRLQAELAALEQNLAERELDLRSEVDPNV